MLPSTFSFRQVYKKDFAEEIATSYQPGNYHRVNIGDMLDGRYEVLQKIGVGRFSTVWLANKLESHYFHDLTNGRTHRLVALKVLAHEKGAHELEVMLRINHFGQDGKPGSRNVIKLLDHFEINGPNGKHLCLVLEYMWHTVADFLRSYGDEPELRLAFAKIISQQLLEGLSFLHGSRIMHNGNSIK